MSGNKRGAEMGTAKHRAVPLIEIWKVQVAQNFVLIAIVVLNSGNSSYSPAKSASSTPNQISLLAHELAFAMYLTPE